MEKKRLRQLFKRKRLELSDEHIKQLDVRLLTALQGLDYGQISFFHVYLPIRRWKEYDTQAFVTWLGDAYPSVRIVISKSDFDTGELRHFVLDERAVIVENAWGIPEPVNEADLTEIMPAQLDVVLIPLLACDRYGNRLGYGKGFYDRFLSACRSDVLKIGVSYFDPLDECLPADEWDVRLDKVVCPIGVVNFGL